MNAGPSYFQGNGTKRALYYRALWIISHMFTQPVIIFALRTFTGVKAQGKSLAVG